MDTINAAVLIVFNLAVLGVIVWTVGGLALRFLGWMWMFFGLAIAVRGAAIGSATGGTYGLALFNVALGAVLWISGHALWALKHGQWRSLTAQKVVRSVSGRS